MLVLLADKHPAVRWALRTILEEEPGMRVIGEGFRLETFLPMVQNHRPDLILLEWELPGNPLDELLATRRRLDLDTRIVVLGRQPEARADALAAGADAFLSKAENPDEFLATLRRIVTGQAETPDSPGTIGEDS